MQLSTLIALSTLLLPSIADPVFGNGFTRLDFQVDTKDAELDSSHGKRLLRKRDDETNASPIILQDLLNFFRVNVSFGSPEQNCSLAIGTGTSDTWVFAKGNPYCKRSTYSKKRSFLGEPIVNKAISDSATGTSSVPYSSATADCEQFGTFDKDLSNTYNSNDTKFQVNYSDYTFAIGEWGTDTFKLGDYELKNYSFGLATAANAESGVLGLGFEDAENTNRGNADPERNYTYSNFPSRLKEDGYIKKKAFSLFLDSYNSTTGSILFGGIDHAKYSGSLVTLPIVDPYEEYGVNFTYFAVTVSGVGTDVNGNETTFSSNKYPAFIDAGTTLTYLPSRFIDDLADSFNATYSYIYGAYVMTCPSLEESLSQFLVIDLSGHKIRVPLYQLIRYKNSYSRCALGIYDSFDGTITLGASFLRSAYTVFDLEDREVSFAQAKYTSDENIEVIESTIPSATKEPDYSSTWSTYEYATTTENIFSDEDDGTTAVDVFGYTGGTLDGSLSIREPSTTTRGYSSFSRTLYGSSVTSSARISSGRTSASETTPVSIGRSTVRAEGSASADSAATTPRNAAGRDFAPLASSIFFFIAGLLMV